MVIIMGGGDQNKQKILIFVVFINIGFVCGIISYYFSELRIDYFWGLLVINVCQEESILFFLVVGLVNNFIYVYVMYY